MKTDKYWLPADTQTTDAIMPTETTVAKPKRQSCGKFFFDCPAPCETTRDGVRCETCGVTVTAQYFEQAYEGRNLNV